MNEHNPKGLDIRFIDSHYKDLFKIPDGGYIKMQYSNGEETAKKCTFIDEYHTQVGFNVFHICQFAEVMERNGTKYQPEPEMMEEQAAWKVGRDRFLAIQTCDDGYDFTLYDENLVEIDGGQLDNPEMTMNEMRNEILEDYKLDKRDLVTTDYDELTERAMELEIQNVREQTQTVDTNIGHVPIEDYREIVALQNGFDSYEDMYDQGIRIGNGMDKDPMDELAAKLDRFAEDFDPYEYGDSVDDKEVFFDSIKKDLSDGNTEPYHEFLNSVIEDGRDETAVEEAKALKDELNKVVPKKESVLDQLSQKPEKKAPTKAPKHKELER